MSKECGTCTKCCDGTLFGVVKGHKMYPGKPCFFLQNNKCSDYENRPMYPCKKYECLWLSDPDVPDFMKPENANVIVDIEKFENTEYMTLTKCNEEYSKEVLNFCIDYAKRKNILFIWNNEKNEAKFMGDQELFLRIYNLNKNKKEYFDNY